MRRNLPKFNGEGRLRENPGGGDGAMGKMGMAGMQVPLEMALPWNENTC